MAHEHPHIQPGSRKEWRAWLKTHHRTARGVWLVYAKKHTGIESLTWEEGVEEALCFGWIDSLRRKVDDTCFKQLYTPRKPTSNWSATNKATIERLIAAGLMTAAGLAAIEQAKTTGRWNAIGLPGNSSSTGCTARSVRRHGRGASPNCWRRPGAGRRTHAGRPPSRKPAADECARRVTTRS